MYTDLTIEAQRYFPDDGITWCRQVQSFKGDGLGSSLTKSISVEEMRKSFKTYTIARGFLGFCLKKFSVISVISV